MQIMQKTKQSKFGYHGIEEYRLYMALNCVASGRGFLGYLTEEEKEILDGTLVDNWHNGPTLTQMGWSFYAELSKYVFIRRHS